MSRKFNATIAPKNSATTKPPTPRTAMELAFSRAAQKKGRAPANPQEKRK